VLVRERVVFDLTLRVGEQPVCRALMSFMPACKRIRRPLMRMSNDGLGVQNILFYFQLSVLYFFILMYFWFVSNIVLMCLLFNFICPRL